MRSFAALGVATSLLGVVGLSALNAPNVSAQVGHSPRSSPYRDIRKGHTFTVLGGYFSGDGGRFNIGPHDGAVFGVRYDVRTGGTLQLGIGIARGRLKRFIVDPFVRLANRKTGPVNQSFTFADVTLQFNLTGGKTWHRIAPFVAASGGVALAGSAPAEPSRYDFGRKLYFAPGAGVRVFLSDRLHLRAEAKATFWRLNYPTTFQGEPVEEPGTPENPNALITDGKLTDWTTSSWLQVGLGYGFTL